MSGPQTLDGVSTITIANNHSGLKQGLEWLGRWLKDHAVGADTDNRAHLVFEEVVTNIIRYAFSDHNEHPIRLGAHMGSGEIMLTFDDDGRPFDPHSAPTFVRPDKLEKAPIGGRGLLLVRSAALRLDYRRTEDGRNLLTVTLASA